MGKEQKNVKFYFWMLILFSVFMLFVSMFGDHGILELRKLNHKKDGVRADIASVKNENVSLKEEIDMLKTSKHYIEKLARKEFGMVKENEIVFLFQD